MSAGDAERLEDIKMIIAELVEESRLSIIIVEGKKDVEALRSLGVDGEIACVNTGGTLFGLCEEMSRKGKRVIIMTDWDSRGGTLCRALQEGLAANGASADTDFRARLAVLSKKGAKDVEGLPSFLETLRRRVAEGLAKHF